MARSSNVPRLFSRHHEGRQAEAALEVIGPILDKKEKDVLDTAREKFRAGHKDPQEALLMLAQLVVLGDLRRKLEQDVKRGNRAMGDLIQQK